MLLCQMNSTILKNQSDPELSMDEQEVAEEIDGQELVMVLSPLRYWCNTTY